MKKSNIIQTIAIGTAALALAFTGCQEKKSDDPHAGHDHEEHEGHDHDDHDHEGHDHGEEVKHVKDPGPNGGRVLTEVEPHMEFLVTKDRKVQIIPLTEDLKPGKLTGQTASIMAGDRTSPTKMSFTADGDKLVSDIAFPEGDDFPLVLQHRSSADSKPTTIKFTMNFTDCPTCDYLEYACICDHEH